MWQIGRPVACEPASGASRSELSESLMSAVAPQVCGELGTLSGLYWSRLSVCAAKGFWGFYGPQVLFFFLSFFFIYCNWVTDFSSVQNHGKERCHSLYSSFLSDVCLREKILCPCRQLHTRAWRRFALASLLPEDSSVSLVSCHDLVGKDP